MKYRKYKYTKGPIKISCRQSLNLRFVSCDKDIGLAKGYKHRGLTNDNIVKNARRDLKKIENKYTSRHETPWVSYEFLLVNNIVGGNRKFTQVAGATWNARMILDMIADNVGIDWPVAGRSADYVQRAVLLGSHCHMPSNCGMFAVLPRVCRR